MRPKTKKIVFGPKRHRFRAAQIIVVMYGQSNMLNMSGTSASPAAANAGTMYFDGLIWGPVPAANGVRQLLNGINSATGKTVGAMNGSVAGVAISWLSKGHPSGTYANMKAMIAASGSVFDYVVWMQGEGDSAVGTAESVYLASLDKLHSDLCGDFNLGKAQVPMLVSGLGINTAGENNGYGTSANWDAMERTLIDSSGNINTFYSHSNRDAVLTDDVHWDAASYGRAGDRFARSITTLIGSTSGFPNWHIASSEVISLTVTRVHLAPGLGTDFTPISGISGFEVSDNNGGTWISGVGARISATIIDVTHSTLTNNSSARQLRHQFGLDPDVSAPVLDNSSLALPLDGSAGALSPTPLATLPVPTYRIESTMGTGSGSAIISQAGLNIVNAATDLLLICGVVESSGQVISSATITPSGGGSISATVVKSDSSNGSLSLLQFLIPNGTDLTNATLAVTFAASVFNSATCAFWTVPQSNLSSTTAVDKQSVSSASATTLSITNLTTSSSGFVIAVALHGNVTANSFTWSGTETYAERFDTANAARQVSGADASGTGASSGASTVTAAVAASASSMRITAASWR